MIEIPVERKAPRRIADLVAAIAMIAAAIAAIYCKLEFAPVSFDAKTWREAGTSSSSPATATRSRMADGLVQSGVLLGKSRGQIQRLLGASTSSHKLRDYDLVYWLGPERGFMGIRTEWLVFRLDAKGQAAELKVVRD